MFPTKAFQKAFWQTYRKLFCCCYNHYAFRVHCSSSRRLDSQMAHLSRSWHILCSACESVRLQVRQSSIMLSLQIFLGRPLSTLPSIFGSWHLFIHVFFCDVHGQPAQSVWLRKVCSSINLGWSIGFVCSHLFQHLYHKSTKTLHACCASCILVPGCVWANIQSNTAWRFLHKQHIFFLLFGGGVSDMTVLAAASWIYPMPLCIWW